MLDVKVGEIKEELLDQILVDALDYLVQTFEDNSLALNKRNHKKKKLLVTRLSSKHSLKLVWAYNAKTIPWYFYGQFAEYDSRENQIRIWCSKKFTLGFILDSLFHEYKHSQQNMYLYYYYNQIAKVHYDENPLEIEARNFAELEVLKFWDIYKKNLAS